MSERLTEKETIKKMDCGEITFQQNTPQEIYFRLGKFEDILEKYEIDTAEELDGVLKPLVENGELENWKSAMFWKMQAQKQLSRWEKLRKFVDNEIINDNKMIERNDNDGYRYLEADECILQRMQELEKESKDEI